MQSFMHRIHFFSRFVSSPGTIGSITPSSKYLVKALLQPVPWNEIDTIVELGAGTGVVTQQIECRVKPSCQAIIFEFDPELRQFLKENYPGFIHCSDARYMTQELKLNGINQVDCVISSLPFANFSEQDRSKILNEIQKVLSPNGLFVAYQYSLQMKAMLKVRFQKVEIHFVPINLPPSFVYICR